MLTVTNGGMTVYDAGVWLSCKQFMALREHHEIDVDYWEFNRKDERPNKVNRSVFKATSDWIEVGLQSKVIFGNVYVGNRPIRAHLSITQCRATLAIYH